MLIIYLNIIKGCEKTNNIKNIELILLTSKKKYDNIVKRL